MPKRTLSSYLREHHDTGSKKKEPGPYVTISRQLGTEGLELGQYLAQKLNQRDENQSWKVYDKEFLQRLSEDTGVPEDVLERERVSKPGAIKDFLRGLNKNPAPDRIEIRNATAQMMRGIAITGCGIIIGHGGAAATSDIANGLKIRLEAPKEWRVARICQQEGIQRTAAEGKIQQFEVEHARVRTFYDQKRHRKPEYHLVFDNSVFSKELAAELIINAMEEKGMIEKIAKTEKMGE